MAVLASAILSRVRTQLVDTNPANQHWSDTELLQWLSDGQRTAALLNPQAAAKRATVALVTGTLQTLPADARMLLDIERNVGGRAIRKADEATLDAFSPNWHNDPAAASVRHYLYNPLQESEFYVYPPNDGTGSIQLIYSASPADLVTTADPIALTDVYATALFDYVMFRCHQKDSDYAAGGGVAQTYLSAFVAALTGGAQGEAAQQPNASGAA